MENKGSKISLLDLSAQFPFDIDEAIKKEICFGETLIISCGHYEGDIDSEESEWSCHDTTPTEVSEEIKDDKLLVVKDTVEEEVEPEQPNEEDDDFHFYFFPDCKKPSPPQHSKSSLLIVNGLPQLNTTAKEQNICTCKLDKRNRCECFTKLPCYCGAKTTAECACSELKKVCICDETLPKPVCTCKGEDVCLCFPTVSPQQVCTCSQVKEPCICYEKSGKYPSPVCPCTHKPAYDEKLDLWSQAIIEAPLPAIEEQSESGSAREVVDENLINYPCTCQGGKLPHCLCLTGKKCCCEVCCVCGVQNTCICEPTETQPTVCRSFDSKIVCECKKEAVQCTCEGIGYECKCYPEKVCTCGSPENCKCFVTCDCTDPCICDTLPKPKPKCPCLEKKKPDDSTCICKKQHDDVKKWKKTRAGRDGYRWCHDVDPRHTYFDYGYDRRDKLMSKQSVEDKIHILGLHDERKDEGLCPVQGVTAPPYKKTVRKPSIDCCSSVGGISICVEMLGEDRDKFLVQVVSHSSKEGANSGTKLVSIFDCNLHTMEENRTEHITKHNLTKERKSYIAICETGYYSKVTRVCGDSSVVKRHYYSFLQAKYFLLEGANVVLLRYFAVTRYRGNVKTDTVLMNGSICENIYVCNGVSQAIVNGKPLFVVKVERHIIEPSGFVHQTLTVLSLKGYMISHEWADNNYMFHINPLLNIVPERDEIEPHAPLRERWREDLQLLSDYLDFKSTRTSEGGRYVTESGALTGTIKDYLQAVLLLRPHDALNFTRHYFATALSALDLPHDEYFDPTQKHVRYFFFEE